MTSDKTSGNTVVRPELSELGITQAHLALCRSPECKDATQLVDAGRDMFDRPQQLTDATLRNWQAMQSAASADGIRLLLVSGYRSFDYQCELIRSKLAQGELIEDILRVNAIPGYSEHHTGCALDLHDGIGEPLSTAFETRAAFAWLAEHAAEYAFALSYPRDNEYGMDYEPWHWRCLG
ncbi:MAG: M15 family metallopeptidase [Pseudomonadales bacterium]